MQLAKRQGAEALVRTGNRKVFLKTFGCQMNVYDSERMSEALGQAGYLETAELADADLVILNTCHIREKAAEKVYSDLGRMRLIKEARARAGNDTVITVAGCVAQAEGPEILRRAPVVDLVVGPQSYHRLPALLDEVAKGNRGYIETDFPASDKFSHLPPRPAGEKVPSQAVSAFLTVQEGCDKFCSFCVVPYTRGSEYSRPVADIQSELDRLRARGVKEVTLLGQNVNAYHGKGPDGRSWTLAQLIRHLAENSDIERIRYTTSHPKDMTPDLIAAHRDEAKLMPYLHLPFQAGSDRVLAAMNRRHTISGYLTIVAKLRRVRPDIALSTDIIVGFPGETRDDFKATLKVVQDVGFAQAYSFKYSARPGTPAANSDAQVPHDEKVSRLAELQSLLSAQQKSFNEGGVGRTMAVLFERTGRQAGSIVGRSPYQQLVHAAGKAKWLGRIMPVKVASASANSLNGVILES